MGALSLGRGGSAIEFFFGGKKKYESSPIGFVEIMEIEMLQVHQA
jgi:hypothetical protein